MAEIQEEKKKVIVLKSNDGETFEVEEEVAAMSETIRQLMEEDDVGGHVIPLPNVGSKILAMVIEYCAEHVRHKSTTKGKGKSDEEVNSWDKDFLNNIEIRIVFDIVLAANYMNIKDLLHLSCQAIAEHIKDKTVEEVREIFNIVNDFTQQEEAEIRKKHAWAFE